MKVLICSFLEPQHITQIREVDARLEVLYHPELLPKPRYAADHVGAPLTRTPEEQIRWEAMLGEAEILFDFDYSGIPHLPERAPKVRWIQATSAGIGQFVKRQNYARMNAVFTRYESLTFCLEARFRRERRRREVPFRCPTRRLWMHRAQQFALRREPLEQRVGAIADQ